MLLGLHGARRHIAVTDHNDVASGRELVPVVEGEVLVAAARPLYHDLPSTATFVLHTFHAVAVGGQLLLAADAGTIATARGGIRCVVVVLVGARDSRHLDLIQVSDVVIIISCRRVKH